MIDTAFALQIQDSGKIILEDLDKLINSVETLAQKHKNTICIGRSHGIHAEVMTFGVKVCSWLDILRRQKENFIQALEQIRVGQVSGPVGTYSNISPEIEEITCRHLGLKPAAISTQIIARDYHAHFMQALALIATVIEQFATLENVPLWHERDISHSSAERIIFPDSLILVDFMLSRFNNIVENLVVHPDNMLKNTEKFGGIVFSQKVLLTLIEKGLTREEAYRIVQRNALDAFENHGDFKKNLLNDKDVTSRLTANEIDEIFDKQEFLKNINTIYERILNNRG